MGFERFATPDFAGAGHKTTALQVSTVPLRLCATYRLLMQRLTFVDLGMTGG